MRYFIYCRKSSEGEERQVLSLASQQEALAKAFGDKADIEIAGVYEEARSAKTPGRPLFAEMLARVEAGEADGIAAWAPDRLARNSIDGGHIIYLLDRGVLRDLKFATYTFENNSQGKFMLSIMFGQSKYYSDALSENVKRGNATKIAMGWRPGRPPIGYLNCPTTRTIIPDPELFPLVRRMFELLLAGHSPRKITLVARDQWGLRSRNGRRRGGFAVSLSGVYKMFSNPFYKGQFLWNGALHRGKHQALVTASEFAQVQTILGRQGKARPQRHVFPFVGMVRCGGCGLMVTAETKRNAYNSLYTYYHCTRRGLGPRCPQPSITADDMEAAIAAFLGTLSVPEDIEHWVRDALREGEQEQLAGRKALADNRSATIMELGVQLQELGRLRMRRMIDDDMYLAERNRLAEERERLLEQEGEPATVDRFELFECVVSFSKYAVDWFLDTDPGTQRRIANSVGSNFSLTDKKLRIQAVTPFLSTPKSGDSTLGCTSRKDVHTSQVQIAEQWLRDITNAALCLETRQLLDTLKTLHRQFDTHDGDACGAIRKGRHTGSTNYR